MSSLDGGLQPFGFNFLGELVNFVRVLKELFCLGFLGETRMEGGSQRASLVHFWAILYARLTGNQSYLEPSRTLIVILVRNLTLVSRNSSSCGSLYK